MNTEDAWTYYVKANDGALPSNAFELINFSRTTDKIPLLSYNKALIIYEKHTKPKKKKKKKKRKSHSNDLKKPNSKTRVAINPISSVTSPTLGSVEASSAAVINGNHSHKEKAKHKKKAISDTRIKDNIEYNISDRILLNKDREGIIKFIGSVHFTNGTVYGIELQNGSIGKHDGMIDDKRYFKTAEKRGIFVKKKAIRRKMRNKDYNTSLRLRRRESVEATEKRMNFNEFKPNRDEMRTVVESAPNEREKSKRKQKTEPPPSLRRRRSSSAKAPKNFRQRSMKNKSDIKSTKSIDDAEIFKRMTRDILGKEYKSDDDNSDWDDVEDEKPRKVRKKQSVDDMVIDNYFCSRDRVHSRIPNQRERKYEVPNKIPSSFKQYQQAKLSRSQTLMSNGQSMAIQPHGKRKLRRRRSSLDLDIGKEPKFLKHVKGSRTAYTIDTNKLKGDTNGKHSHSRFQSVTSALSKGWTGFNLTRKNKNKNKSKQKKKKDEKALIFGMDPLKLDATLLDDYESAIPNVLITLGDALFAHDGHLIEGIFRIAPHAARCKQIEKELNEGKMDQIEFDEIDGGLIANLIKIWFRKMPDPILQSIDSSKIEKVQNTKNMEQNMQQVEEIIMNDMKEPNKSYFEWLLDLSVHIVKHEKINKMSSKNMAVVISPNLFDPTKIENPMRIMTLSTAAVAFLELAIQWRAN